MPLEIGVILPSFHAEGKVSVEIERLNNMHNDGAMLRDVDFIILGEIHPVQPRVLGLTPLYKGDQQGSYLDQENHT